MRQKKEFLNKIRDCVRQAFLNGCERGYEFRKMRHAIIIELKRLGYTPSEIKDELLEWNKRCEKPLRISEQRGQLLRYVDWAMSKKCNIGCKALEDYCIGKKNCQFYKKTTYQKRQQTQRLPFNLNELEKFLTKRYKRQWYTMMLIIKALRLFQSQKATGETIYIGYRKISSIIRDKYGHTLTSMDIFRKMKLLIDEGVIEQVFKGKSGDFSWQANGYKLLPWRKT